MRVVKVLVALVLAGPVAGCSGDDHGPAQPATTTTAAPATTSGAPPTTTATPTVRDLVGADRRLRRVAAALEQPGLAELARRLDDPHRSSTLFAPVDAGLGGVSDARLATLLPAHVVDGAYLATDLARAPRLRSLAGSTLVVTVGDDGALVGPARLVTTDVEAANGVVHLVDRPVVTRAPRGG